MKRTMSKVVLVSVGVALLMGAQPVSGQLATAQKLSITDLGTPAGGRFSLAADINNRGQVVGTYLTDSGEFLPFLWEDGKKIDLGTLPGGGYSVASGINSRGQVVGDSKGRAVLWHR
jgi:probable HAF family extracellular repeat protein